jgi:hypothetical protein
MVQPNQYIPEEWKVEVVLQALLDLDQPSMISWIGDNVRSILNSRGDARPFTYVMARGLASDLWKILRYLLENNLIQKIGSKFYLLPAGELRLSNLQVSTF